MAFMGRGDFPFEENDDNGDCDDTSRLDYYHCGHYYRTYYYYH